MITMIGLLLYSAFLRSRADSLHSYVILHEWLAFDGTFFEYPLKWCTYSAGMTWLVPHEPAAVSAQVLCTPYNHAAVRMGMFPALWLKLCPDNIVRELNAQLAAVVCHSKQVVARGSNQAKHAFTCDRQCTANIWTDFVDFVPGCASLTFCMHTCSLLDSGKGDCFWEKRGWGVTFANVICIDR